MAPLQLGGLRGKKSTPSFGWEVPVKSHRSESGSYMERVGKNSDQATWAMVRFLYFAWNIISILTLLVLYF
jgi:hypothetical protein